MQGVSPFQRILGEIPTTEPDQHLTRGTQSDTQEPDDRMPKAHRVNEFTCEAYRRLLQEPIPIDTPLLALLLAQSNIRIQEPVVVLGSKPIKESRMIDIASKLDMPASRTATADSQYLIIGQDGWTYEEVRELLEYRKGSTLRVYSQEMFLAYAMSGIDPLANISRVVEALAGHHPALRFLRKAFTFEWPSTDVVPSNSNKWLPENIFSDQETGFLKYEGYSVGKTGRPTANRRKILDYCYLHAIVPSVFPIDYASEWSDPGTSDRLRKLANCIAAFCRNAKKKNYPPLEAIKCWEDDLEYLRHRYYEGRYVFEWPHMEAW